MRPGEYITEYEVKLGTKVAEVLCGGNVTSGTPISEQDVLDLEGEAFKSLCGERKTRMRTREAVSLRGFVESATSFASSDAVASPWKNRLRTSSRTRVSSKK